MKKLYMFLFLFLLPILVVHAEDINYKIDKLYIEAHIQENGDMKVKELFLINGYFNGYEREISYGSSSQASDGSFDSSIASFFVLFLACFV